MIIVRLILNESRYVVEKLLFYMNKAAIFLQRKMRIFGIVHFSRLKMEGNRDTGRKQGR